MGSNDSSILELTDSRVSLARSREAILEQEGWIFRRTGVLDFGIKGLVDIVEGQLPKPSLSRSVFFVYTNPQDVLCRTACS
jgi:hypothetical protein